MVFATGNDSTGTHQTTLMGGVDSEGKVRAIAVNTDGTVKTAGSNNTGGGSGGGITSTVWTDNTGSYFIRRETVDSNGNITANYVTPADVVAIPGAGLRPLSSTDRDVETAYYEAIASGAGYSVGDLLARTLIIDVNPSTPTLTAIWINFSTGAVISSPPNSAQIERADENIAIRGDVSAGTPDSGNPVKIGGVYNSTPPTLASGQRGNLQLSSRSNLLIDTIDFVSSPTNIQSVDSNSTTSIGQDGQTIIRGNPSNNSFASYASSGNSSFAILIENQPTATSFVGTLQIERSLDGNVWTAISAFVAGSAYTRSQITAEAVLHGNCSSSQFLRVRAIAWTSGTAKVTFLVGQGVGTITIGNPIRLFDQISGTQATIKAANTQPSLTDTALVPAIRDLMPVNLTLTTSVVGSYSDGSQSEFDVSGFSWFSVQITTGNGTTQVQATNDNSNNSFWEPQALELITASTTGASSSSALTDTINGNIRRIYAGKIVGRYLRFRATAIASGTMTAVIQLHRIPKQHDSLKAIAGNVTVGSIVNPVPIGATTVISQTYIQGTINTSGDNTIIAAPTGGQRIYISSFTIQLEATTTTTVLLKSGANSFKRIRMVADADGIDKPYSPAHLFTLNANEAFILNLSGANTVGYSIEYRVA